MVFSKSHVFDYESNRRKAFTISQLIALYIILDAFCLSYMSLTTFCIIKLGLTATFTVRDYPQNDDWLYTARGTPHYLLRRIGCLILFPAAILNDVLFQVVYRDAFDQIYFRGPTASQKSDDEFVFKEWLIIYIITLTVHLFNTIVVY